ncbi:6-carboxytetrahydropterin synthase QueD [Desulfuribacillus stibiiarsenatis]|uniref:6-carboxy-5,6,7,8-tetrahydropterin synthase n=1 Tax=Desulfuribacillus stibiiarsenatis TaxID=1390249 RepID=A0A1E5L6U8_9FIRM|nr:6-carboxytetrahydropterin synthase QueD [Desulfuribacillus stibiiarsenatis]OEH85734.1 6-carboxytetrahydropterin synthase QueD [Desulfuribacillus stibiiarsenatis]
MYELKIITHFDSAHSLRGYNGDCANLHGHTWTIEVYVEGDQLNEIGLLVDFKEVKKYTNEIIKRFDHQCINQIPGFRENELNPTAENLSRYIYEELAKLMSHIDIQLKKISVWESPNACATYFPNGKS